MRALSNRISTLFMNGALERRLPNWLQVMFDVVGIALLALFLAGFVERNVMHQGDLKTYQLAARVALAGSDPYRPEELSALAGHRVFPFVYPPVALLPFLLVDGLAPKTVALAWIWAKIAILGVLVLAWGRWFARETALLAVALVATFGWNSSAQWDLAAGNVAIVECALVWAALGCFLAGRRTLFTLLIVAASCFKLTPAAFMLLLLVPTRRAGASPWRLALGLSALALFVLGPTVWGPASSFQPFWAHVPDATTYGYSNPSALGLAALIAGALGPIRSLVGPVTNAMYGAYALAVLAGSFPLLRRTYMSMDASRWAMTAVFLYVLLMPRPMAYGFVLLTPAPLYFSPRPFHTAPGRWFLALILAAQGLWRLTSNVSGSPLVIYAPFLLSLCIWLLVVNEDSIAAVAPEGAAVASGDDRTGSLRQVA